MTLNTRQYAPKPSLVQQAFDRIKHDILDGTHAPGSQLSEHQLATELGVSRTPVREALRDLAANGLISIVPQRGIVVSQLSAADASDIYRLREPLECLAIRLAVDRIDDADRKAYLADHSAALAALSAGDIRAALTHAHQMHTRTAQLANSPRLLRILQDIADETRRYGLLAPRHDHTAQIIENHGAIIQALIHGDGPAAETLMIAYLHAERDYTLRTIVPAGAARPAPPSAGRPTSTAAPP
jgi:DNA-binding GntR family transcriptional regulator